MAFKLIPFTENAFFYLGLRTCNEKVLFEQHIMNHESECPNIDFWAILFFSKNLRWHEDRRADYFIVDLFLYSKTEVTQLVKNVVTLFLQKYIVRLEISVNDIVFGNELDTPSKLVDNLNRLRLRKSSSFDDDLLKVTVRTKLKDHCNVVLSQKTIVNFCSKHSVGICAERKLSQDTHLSIYNKVWIYWWFIWFYCRTSWWGWVEGF